MAEYTANYKLYKPNRADTDPVDTTLSANFQILDGEIKKREIDIDTVTTEMEAKADDLQSQLNRIIIESGTSDAEVIQARGDAVTLNDRLNGIDSQLAINVRIYGATGAGDNTIVDTDGIQAVLDLAKPVIVAKPIKVVVPKGVYRLKRTLKIYKNTHLIIEDGAVLLRDHGTTLLINGDEGATYTGYDGQGDITIQGGVWDGNISEWGTDGFITFGIARGRNINLKHITFKDAVDSHAIDLNACENVYINKCKFLGFKDNSADPTLGYIEAIQVSSHTQAGFSVFGTFDGTPCKNVNINDCTFGTSDTEGAKAWAVGVGNHASVYGQTNDNIKINNCRFFGMTYAAIRSFKYDNVSIKQNKFYGCQVDIMLSNPDGSGESGKDGSGAVIGLPEASKNIFIKDNLFKNTKKECISGRGGIKGVDNIVKMYNVVIKDNAFEDQDLTTLSDCVSLRWVDNVKIKDNTYKNVHCANFLTFVSNVDLKDNKAENLTEEFLYMDESFEPTYQNLGHTNKIRVKENIIKNAGRSGIFVQHVDGFDVSNNQLDTVGIETDNTRSGIVAESSKNGKIHQNTVKMAMSGNQNKYGLDVRSTCENVQSFNNNLEGKTGRQTSVGATNFDGFYIHGATNDARYIVTVSDAGALTIALG